MTDKVALRSIPPTTSTGLRSADPRRFRTRTAGGRAAEEAGGLPPVLPVRRPERRKPLVCSDCGGTNISGAEERGGVWWAWCVICDGLKPAKEVS